jgi:stage IV sporulation protein FB
LLVGVWYACTGELFLFLLSALVAIQHECAHAFASARLGYQLNKIVLMPFGAVIDGDLRGISFKDEIYVAACGPLCNLITAAFFVALWWLVPTMYAFTDTACYSSLAIALVNLLPAYPLDGGRILRCALAQGFQKHNPNIAKAEKRANKICRIITLAFAGGFLFLFALLCTQKNINVTLLAFSFFLIVGAFGNRDKQAVYQRLDFSSKNALRRGVEIRRIAVLNTCTVKKALRFLSSSSYLVLEIYDEKERHLFDLPQNLFSDLFALSASPYETLENLYQKLQKIDIYRKNKL